MNAIGYVRLSSRDQSRYSLEEQESSIREYCMANGLNLLEVFRDNGQKSSTFDRLDFRAMEAFAKRHRGEVRYLVVMEHDRFSRDLAEALSKIRSLESVQGLKLVAVDEPLDIDPSDPSSFISRAFKYATANAELLNIRTRTRRGIARARQEGRYANRAPYGYANERDHDGKGILVPMEAETIIVKRIFECFLSRLPFSTIALVIGKIGFRLKGHSAIRNILSNCLYAGLVRVSGDDKSDKYVKGIHRPVISERDFWLVQEMLNRKKPQRMKCTDDFPLKGLLKCHCGKYMTAGWSRGRRKRYLYYRCTVHKSPNVPGKKVHEQFDRILSGLVLDRDQMAHLATIAGERLEKRLEDRKAQLASRRKMMSELDAKMDKLESLLIEGHIGIHIFEKWTARYGEERARLQRYIDELGVEMEASRTKLETFVAGMTVPDICSHCQAAQRLFLLKSLFRYGLFFHNGQLAESVGEHLQDLSGSSNNIRIGADFLKIAADALAENADC